MTTTGQPRPRIVTIGGGSGQSLLLGGLKDFWIVTGQGDCLEGLTAIVTTADDGGSSGRLTRDLGVPALGDLRRCLVALAECPGSARELFGYRFTRGAGLEGHSLGNLMLAALAEPAAGGLDRAVAAAADLLKPRARVYPATAVQVELVAELADGTRVRGEDAITHRERQDLPVQRLWLQQAGGADAPRAGAGVVEAIEAANLIVLGPGSLLTSVAPVLLVPEVGEAVRTSRARRVLVCNILTQAGETDDFAVEDHAETLTRLTGVEVDVVVGNDRDDVAPELRPRRVTWRGGGSAAVGWRREPLARGDGQHDPLVLARTLVALAQEGS